MGDYIEPLNIKYILYDLFLGHPSMVAFALVILISFVSARFQMSNRNFMIILVISSLILAGYLGEAVYILILVIIGIVTFYSLSRMFR